MLCPKNEAHVSIHHKAHQGATQGKTLHQYPVNSVTSHCQWSPHVRLQMEEFWIRRSIFRGLHRENFSNLLITAHRRSERGLNTKQPKQLPSQASTATYPHIQQMTDFWLCISLYIAHKPAWVGDSSSCTTCHWSEAIMQCETVWYWQGLMLKIQHAAFRETTWLIHTRE